MMMIDAVIFRLTAVTSRTMFKNYTLGYIFLHILQTKVVYKRVYGNRVNSTLHRFNK